MTSFLHSPTGLIHLIAALAAMGFGTAVVLLPKATRTHKRIGYAYVTCIAGVNVTAFLLYDLFGTFGPFHVAALFSSATLLAGLLPVLQKRPAGQWRVRHYYFMSWSVVGLYCAFWAETLVRFFPIARFWPVVVIATFATSLIGNFFIRRNAARLTGHRLHLRQHPDN